MTRTPKVMQRAKNPKNPSAQVSRAGQPADPAIRSFPSETRKAPGSWTAWVAGLCGTLTSAAGAAMIWGPAQSPEVADMAAKMEAAGVLPGHLFAAGGALMGLSVVGLLIGRVARTLLRPGAVEDALTEVGADLAEYRNKLYEFENDHVHFRATLEGLAKQVREHREKDRSQEAIDALFRMAGSLDTLHARFDQKLTETSQGVGQTLSELGGLVEAARDYLQDSLEETDQRVEQISNQVTELLERPAPQFMAPPESGGEEICQEEPDYVPQDVEPEPQPGAEPELSLESSDDEPLGLGLLDELDDMESESWCDEEVQQEMAALEEARSSTDAPDAPDEKGPEQEPQASDQGSNDAPSLVSLDPVPVPAIPEPEAIEPPAPIPMPDAQGPEPQGPEAPQDSPAPPTTLKIEPPAPLPSQDAPAEEGTSHLEEMTDVVRDPTSTRIIEGLDFGDDTQS